MVIGAIQGEGGPIYWLSMALTDAIVGTSKQDAWFGRLLFVGGGEWKIGFHQLDVVVISCNIKKNIYIYIITYLEPN